MKRLAHRLLLPTALVLAGLFLPSAAFSAEDGGRKVNIVLDQSLKPDQTVVWIGYGVALAAYLQSAGIIATLPEGRYNPTFEAEYSAREKQLQIWREISAKQAMHYPYMDRVAEIANAGFLREYVWFVYFRPEWGKPARSLRLQEFVTWGRDRLIGHQSQTGAWVELVSATATDRKEASP